MQPTPNKLFPWGLEPQQYYMQCRSTVTWTECASTGGWTCVANLSDPYQQCPGEWNLQTHSSELRRLCGRGSNSAGCLSAMYNTYGKIVARQRCAIPIRSNSSFCVHKQTTATYWQAEQSLLPCCACVPTFHLVQYLAEPCTHSLEALGKRHLA